PSQRVRWQPNLASRRSLPKPPMPRTIRRKKAFLASYLGPLREIIRTKIRRRVLNHSLRRGRTRDHRPGEVTVMHRSWFALLFVFAAVASFAQTEIPLINDSSQTMTTPTQLRRIEPPSPTASVKELEERGDILRAEKYYADAIDYYQAAIKKSPNPAQL